MIRIYKLYKFTVVSLCHFLIYIFGLDAVFDFVTADESEIRFVVRAVLNLDYDCHMHQLLIDYITFCSKK